MDSAVALVQAYLRVNGYFTVTEYPVFEAPRGGPVIAATDLDVLAFRFPGAGRPLVGAARGSSRFAPDPELGCPAKRPDMLLGEVKEGKALLNAAARDPRVVRAVLERFGCCQPDDAARVAERLVRHGSADTPHGHRVRLVAFGSRTADLPRARYQRISLGHVGDFLREYLAQHWEVVRHGQFKDPALGLLLTLEKAARCESEPSSEKGGS